MSGILDPAQTTTIYNWKRGAEDSVMQNNRFFRAMHEKSQVTSDEGGEKVSGPIEAGRHTPYISAPGEDLTPKQTTKNRWALWNLPWGQTNITAAWNVGLFRRNYGQQALVDIKGEEIAAMLRDMFDGSGSGNNEIGLQYQILNTNAETYAGTGLPIHGIPTFLLAPGATGVQGFDGISTATGSGPADTDKEAIPTATSQAYAGLNLYRSGLTGVDGLEADAWTPTLVNSSYSGWTATADDEANSLPKAYEWAVQRMCRFSTTNKSALPDAGFCDLTSLNRLASKLEARQTIYVDAGQQKSNDAFGMGYNATTGRVFHSGIWWYWDENMPSETAYLLNFKKSRLMCQPKFHTQTGTKLLTDSKSVASEGAVRELLEMHVGFDQSTLSQLLTFLFAGQVMFHPRYQCRIGNYS